MNMMITKSTKWLRKMKKPMMKPLTRAMLAGFNNKIPESVLTPDDGEDAGRHLGVL